MHLRRQLLKESPFCQECVLWLFHELKLSQRDRLPITAIYVVAGLEGESMKTDE